MDWNKYIHSDPEILLGKPVVKGTRLSVDFLMRLFASGWNEQQILDSYPVLTKESINAIFAYVADCMSNEYLYSFPIKMK